jgi:prefoldin subunit 5
MAERSSETEILAQELEHLGIRIGHVERRLAEVEAIIARLETAAETTARGMEEISAHWDQVYKAMRRG